MIYLLTRLTCSSGFNATTTLRFIDCTRYGFREGKVKGQRLAREISFGHLPTCDKNFGAVIPTPWIILETSTTVVCLFKSDYPPENAQYICFGKIDKLGAGIMEKHTLEICFFKTDLLLVADRVFRGT